MSRIEKLNARLLSGGKLSFAEFRRLAEAYGFKLIRTKGSHHIFARDGVADLVNIQPVGGGAKPYQLRQFIRILEAYNLTLDGRE